MAIGGYTTAILMSNSHPPLELFGHQFTNDVRDILDDPLAGLVAGIVGFLFGFPCPQAHGPLSRPRDVRRRGRDAGDHQEVRAVHGRRRRDQHLRGRHPQPSDRRRIRSPSRLSASHPHARIRDRELQRVALLPELTIALVMFVGAWFILRGRVGRAFRAVRDRSSPPHHPASTSRPTRRSPSASAPSTPASRERCSRSRRRS